MAIVHDDVKQILESHKREFSLHILLKACEDAGTLPQYGVITHKMTLEHRDFFVLSVPQAPAHALFPGYLCERHFSIDRWYDKRNRVPHGCFPMHYTERYTLLEHEIVMHAFLDRNGVYQYCQTQNTAEEIKETAELEQLFQQNFQEVITMLDPLLAERDRLYTQAHTAAQADLTALDHVSLMGDRKQYMSRAEQFFSHQCILNQYGDIQDTRGIFIQGMIKNFFKIPEIRIKDAVEVDSSQDTDETPIIISSQVREESAWEGLNALYLSLSALSKECYLQVACWEAVLERHHMILEIEQRLLDLFNGKYNTEAIEKEIKYHHLALSLWLIKITCENRRDLMEIVFPQLSSCYQDRFFERLYRTVLESKTLGEYLDVMDYFYENSVDYRQRIITAWNDKPIETELYKEPYHVSLLLHFFRNKNQLGFEMLLRHGVSAHTWGIKRIHQAGDISIFNSILICDQGYDFEYLSLLLKYSQGKDLFIHQLLVNKIQQAKLKHMGLKKQISKQYPHLMQPMVAVAENGHSYAIEQLFDKENPNIFLMLLPYMPAEDLGVFLGYMFGIECFGLTKTVCVAPGIYFANNKDQAHQQANEIACGIDEGVFMGAILYPVQAVAGVKIEKLQKMYDVLVKKISCGDQDKFHDRYCNVLGMGANLYHDGEYMLAYQRFLGSEILLNARWKSVDQEKSALTEKYKDLLLRKHAVLEAIQAEGKYADKIGALLKGNAFHRDLLMPPLAQSGQKIKKK